MFSQHLFEKGRKSVLSASVFVLCLGLGLALFTGCPQAAGNLTDPDTPPYSPVPGSDATLKSLAISSGELSPGFNPAVKNYSAIVPNAVDSITVTGAPNSAKASLSANNGVPQPLSVGSNTIALAVTAEDGASAAYTVTVTRVDNSVVLITSEEELALIGGDPGYPAAGAYILAKNLTLENWKPVGTDTAPFSGSLDGGNYVVTLKSFHADALGDTYSYLGIFGSVKGASDSAKASIKDVKLVSAIDQDSTNTTGQAVGTLAGYTENAVIENIAFSGAFKFSAAKNSYAGGIVGYAQKGSVIKDCNSSAAVDFAGGGSGGLFAGMYYNYAGGFVGVFKDGVEIVNCHNTGNVTSINTTASSQIFAGGIAGGSYYTFSTEYQGKIEDCSNTGDVYASAKGFWTWAGGIIGAIVGDGDGSYEKTSRVVRCYATGTVSIEDTGSSFPYVGGIAAYNYYGALISQCYFTGAVKSNKGSQDYAGGIAGYNSQQTGHNSRVEDCWSSGTVTGYTNAGGIVGQNQVNTYIRRCYSTATITVSDGTGTWGAGGITGLNASLQTDAVTACAALNPSVRNLGTNANSKTRTHRTVGFAQGAAVHTSNIAWSGMILENSDGAITPDSDAAGLDGADCAQKPAQSVFTDMGWDFAAVWKMGSNGYPALKWQ